MREAYCRVCEKFQVINLSNICKVCGVIVPIATEMNRMFEQFRNFPSSTNYNILNSTMDLYQSEWMIQDARIQAKRELEYQREFPRG